jgi:hypothetical protein
VKRSGWVTFSAVVLIIAGVMRIFDAIWAFRYKGTVVDGLNQALFGHSLKTYGWVWLVIGIVLIVAGFLVLIPRGIASEVSRWIGIVAAGALAITAATWLAYYPVWTLVYIGISVMVIYGLSAHFEVEAPRRDPAELS